MTATVDCAPRRLFLRDSSKRVTKVPAPPGICESCQLDRPQWWMLIRGQERGTNLYVYCQHTGNGAMYDEHRAKWILAKGFSKELFQAVTLEAANLPESPPG